MTNDLKWMIGSDFHIPFTHPRYMELWWKVMKWYKPDVIDYLGDIDDQSCVSRWSEGSADEILNSIKTYAPEVQEFYRKTREMNPNAQLFNALGNHDVRVFDYVDKKAKALTGLITPESMWGLDSLGYDYIYYNDKPAHRFGDIYGHHGVSISKHAGESVRNDIDTFGVSIIRGHSHRQGAYFRTYEMRNGGKGETWRGYEIGHMTDINSKGMAYTNSHNWQPGFAIATIESVESSPMCPDGYYPHIQIITISPDFTCYVNGKKFSA